MVLAIIDFVLSLYIFNDEEELYLIQIRADKYS